MKYETRNVTGYWFDDPENEFDVVIALGVWDGIEDNEDGNIFYYMDGEPLKTGMIISDGFVVKEIM